MDRRKLALLWVLVALTAGVLAFAAAAYRRLSKLRLVGCGQLQGGFPLASIESLEGDRKDSDDELQTHPATPTWVRAFA
jgi:hypothetical protein